MPDSPLSLTAHQYHVLESIGIDTWYLTPLTRENTDAAFRASQEHIAELVEQLTTEITPPSSDANLTAVAAQRSDSTPTLDASDISAHSAADALGASEQRARDTKTKTTDKQLTQVISYVGKQLSIDGKNKTALGTVQETQTIRLNPQLDVRPPEDSCIDFPVPAPAFSSDMSRIHEAAAALRENNVGVASKEILVGQGSQSPEWLVILPPPTAQHIENQQLFSDDERCLFQEVLSAAGRTWDTVYATPVLKQAVHKHRDPGSSLLGRHLPILAAEIALLKPQRIVVMGRIASHVLLQTNAPLGQMMGREYAVRLDTREYSVSVLPSLDYFLMMPAEKHCLWRNLKRLF